MLAQGIVGILNVIINVNYIIVLLGVPFLAVSLIMAATRRKTTNLSTTGYTHDIFTKIER
ncbi:MAG: hypothetical protein KKA19_02090 [Candidatus Margulisbacteria bacterium]|nr:hypothetical protein [Candidatus Margulisiibacteriota bacterium]